METIEIAQRLISLCKAGHFMQAQLELYDSAIISIEVDGTRTIGAAPIRLREQRLLDTLEKINNIEYSDILIAGNYFAVVLTMEMEIKNAGRKNISEVCVYGTMNGKITFEQFFRN